MCVCVCECRGGGGGGGGFNDVARKILLPAADSRVFRPAATKRPLILWRLEDLKGREQETHTCNST